LSRQKAYRKRVQEGAHCATFVLTPAWLEAFIDRGFLNDFDLDIDDHHERKRRLDLALARYLYATKPDRVTRNAAPFDDGLLCGEPKE
jgi:hypothetical protein